MFNKNHVDVTMKFNIKIGNHLDNTGAAFQRCS